MGNKEETKCGVDGPNKRGKERTRTRRGDQYGRRERAVEKPVDTPRDLVQCVLGAWSLPPSRNSRCARHDTYSNVVSILHSVVWYSVRDLFTVHM